LERRDDHGHGDDVGHHQGDRHEGAGDGGDIIRASRWDTGGENVWNLVERFCPTASAKWLVSLE
jgi:hypothetical protein